MQRSNRLAAVGAVMLALLSLDTQAQTRYSVYVDSDDNAATGCTLTLPGGSFAGADRLLEASIATGASPMVTGLSLSACSGGVFPAGTAIGGGYPVGTNNGFGGADVVELGGPLAQLSTRGVSRVRVAFAADNGTGSDLLATQTGLVGAPPIFLGVPMTIPTLGWGAMLLMGLALLLVAARFGKNRLLARVLGASLLAGSGVGLAANFILDGNVGDWSVGPLATDPLADSSDGSAVVDIVAGFGAVENETMFFRIDAVELQNQPPVVTPVAVATNEDTPVTVNLTATDPEGQPVTFAIVSGPTNGSLGTLTQLPPNAASLQYTPNADFFGSDSFTVSANDGQATSAPATVSITVNPVNDVPVFTVGPDVSVLKDTGPQTIDPWATGISAGPANEAGQLLTFVVAGNDNPTLFSAGPTVSATGVLSFTGVADANGTANISLQLQDDGGTANGGVDTSAVQTFAITLTAVNDPPSFSAGPDQTVLEDAGAQTVNPWATAISAGPPDESGQALTFNITGNSNPTLFSAGPAVSATGVLTYTPAADANGSASITLTLQDDGGGNDTSAPQTFAINVTAVNDVPAFTAQDPPAVNEDAGAQSALVATAISAGPPDESAQTLAFSITNNSNPALFNGVPTINSAGQLGYTPAANTSGSAVLTFQLQDNGGTANGGVDTSATQTITVTVNSVNDVPSFAAGANQSVNEDAGAQTVNPWATALSAGPPDEAGQTLAFNITGNTNPGLFSAQPSVSPAGVLSYTPVADAFGVATITLTVQDNGGTANGGIDTSAPQSFTISVLSVNDVPSFTVGPDIAVAVGAGAQTFNPWATALSAGPANESSQTLAFTITANSNPGLFSAGPLVSPTGVLTFTGAGGGSANLSLRVQDNGGIANGGVDTSATQNFVITIDSPPSVIATTPVAAALVPDNQALSVSFSENITTLAAAVTLSCNAGPNLITGGATGTGVATLTPTYTAPLPAGNCVLTVIAANVTDSDTIDPPDTMAANVVVNFSVDAAPTVNSVSPTNGSSNQSTTAPIVIGFSESVAATGSAFSVECPVGSPVAFGTSASPAASYTLTPTTSWPGGATCTVTVFAAQISDADLVDPPNLMAANFVSTFATDAAPTVTGGLPADTAVNVATSSTVTFTFSENVDAGPGAAITLNCGGAIAGSISGGGSSTLTFTPSAALPAGSACTATAVAANIGDSDLFDPPNNLAANAVKSFTTDAPPLLTGSVPANGATAQPATGTITLNFSEPVNFDGTANAANLSFDLECPGGTPADFVVLTASPAASVVLDPLDSALAGRSCVLTVRSAGITDADLGDPPDNLPADVAISIAFAGVAVDDALAATPHLTLSSAAGATELDANDVLGAEVISSFGFAPACTGTAAGAQLDAGAANGRLTINADGSFSYEPPAAVAGSTRTFCYTITGGDTANVVFTLQATELVWFIDGSAPAGGVGNQARPFQALNFAAALDTANDTLFLADGSYSDSITLEVGERLIGDGATGALATHSGVNPVLGSAFPAFSTTAPVLSCAGTCLTLPAAGNNVLRGLTVGNSGTTGTGISGTGFGTLTVSGVTVNGNGRALGLTTGTLSGDFLDIDVSSTTGAIEGLRLDAVGGTWTVANPLNFGNTAGNGIDIRNAPAGASMTFTGGTVVAKTSAGSAVLLSTNNAGATLNLGTVTLSNSLGTALSITASPLTIGGAASTLTATGGPALDATNANFVGGATFATVSSTTSAGKGINLDTVTGALVMSGGAVSGAVGNAFDVNAGASAISYSGSLTSTAAARLVEITARSGGAVTLSGNLSGTGATHTGINVASNTGGSIDFSGATKTLNTATNNAITLATNTGATVNFTGGGLAVTTTSGTGFNATGGATGISVQGAANTISTTTGIALNVAATNIAAAGLNFRSINAGTGAGSAGVGISIDGGGVAAGNGGLGVSGTGVAGSGGTIQHKTGADGVTNAGIGIFLKDTKSVSLNWMQMNDFDNSAIVGRNVQGFTLSDSVINGAIGNSSAPVEGPIMFGLTNPGGVNGLQGTGIIHNTKVSGGIEHNLEFYNQTGAMNLTIDGTSAVSEGANPNSAADDAADCAIGFNSVAFGSDGVLIETQGTSTATVMVDRCLFRDNKSQAIQVAANDSSAVALTINGSFARRLAQGNEGVVLSNGSNGDLTTLVSGNVVNQYGGVGLFVGQTPGNATASSLLQASLTNNTINSPVTATNHSVIAFLTSTVGQISQARLRVDGNTVAHGSNSGTTRALTIDTPDAGTSPKLDSTVTNNSLAVTDVTALQAVAIQSRQSADGCASIGGNTATTAGGVAALRARQVAPALYDLEQSAVCAGAPAAVLACRNPASTTEIVGTLTVTAVGSCLTPALP